MKNRYLRNIAALSVSETEALHEKKVFVAGCGGLGGYIAETLARIGVLNLTVIDGDVFEETNLNRQLFSTMSALGRHKANTAKERLADVNPDVRVSAVCERLTEANAEALIKGHDLVMDALDNISTRLIISDACAGLGLPLVHGAIAGWYGQVASVFPGDKTLEKLYGTIGGNRDKGIENPLGNLPFTAAAVAAFQCAEAVKILTGRGEPIRNAFARLDLLNSDFSVIPLN